jgi:hypothetical protein
MGTVQSGTLEKLMPLPIGLAPSRAPFASKATPHLEIHRIGGSRGRVLG